MADLEETASVVSIIIYILSIIVFIVLIATSATGKTPWWSISIPAGVFALTALFMHYLSKVD